MVSRMARRLVAGAATIGVFSYSLYLTHELVIMQSWSFVIKGFPQILNALLIVIPATVAFAWVFFKFCEQPYMRKAGEKVERAEDHRAEEPVQVFSQTIPVVADEA